MATTTGDPIAVLEGLIGFHFPAEHRRLLLQHDGWSTAYGDTVLQFSGVEDIRSRYLLVLHEGPFELVDFIVFAGDQDGGLYGYDRRVEPSPVVMMERTPTDWSGAKLQGFSFASFLGRLVAGKGIDQSTSYAGPTD